MGDERALGEKEAVELGALLAEHQGGGVIVMDMRPLGFWTDFFVIATVSSGAHLGGLERHIKEFARQRGTEPKRSPRPAAGEEWCLVDLGTVVIHLMTPRVREFYELERLWREAPVIFEGGISGV